MYTYTILHLQKEGEKPAEGPLYDLNDENFAKFTQTGYHFIKFLLFFLKIFHDKKLNIKLQKNHIKSEDLKSIFTLFFFKYFIIPLI
jgi:hypothetical protein